MRPTLVKCVHYDAPHCADVSIVQFIPPSYAQIFLFSSASCSQIPSVCIVPLGRETKFHTYTEQQLKV
jgi:hypothetical protein